MRFRTIIAALTVTTLALSIAPARADHVETVVTFDLAAGELPEGVAVDRRDNVYVSLIAPVSEIRKITPSGQQSTLVDLNVGGFGPLGLAVGAGGAVYAAVATSDPATQGVYRVNSRRDRDAAARNRSDLFPERPRLRPPRQPVRDRHGRRRGLADPPRWLGRALDPRPAPRRYRRARRGGPSRRERGIAVAHRRRAIVVSNTELGTLLRIRIRRDGTAGELKVAAEDPALFGVDGIALARSGAGRCGRERPEHDRPSGWRRVHDDRRCWDGINGASAVAFGARRDRRNLFAVNFGVFSPAPTPSLLKIAVGVRGAP